jgi:hypothetical protein
MEDGGATLAAPATEVAPDGWPALSRPAPHSSADVHRPGAARRSGSTLEYAATAGAAGYAALDAFDRTMRARGHEVLDWCAREGRPCLLAAGDKSTTELPASVQLPQASSREGETGEAGDQLREVMA